MSDFDRYSLTIARWLTHVYDEGDPIGISTTPGDVTLPSSLLRAHNVLAARHRPMSEVAGSVEGEMNYT